MLVGEQPGNDEDLAGHPFVGPAGTLLDAALGEAGLSREEVYVTNAVKHFKFVTRGKRRLHERPKASEVEACRPWLGEELRLVQPRIVVALGATATSVLFSADRRVTRDRGRLLPLAFGIAHQPKLRGLLTIHPAAALRGPSSARRKELRAMLVDDLRLARERAGEL